MQVDPAVAQWFSAVDQDNSGHIDAKELGQVLPAFINRFIIY